MAQTGPAAPPVVGVVKVERRPMIESDTFNGRIEPVLSVNIVARIAAFVEKKPFVDGSEVNRDDVLFTLERPPFQAAVDLHKAAVAQAEAQLENANTELWRKQQLLQRNAGTMWSARHPPRWQQLSARTKCTWCFQFRCAVPSSCASSTRAKAVSMQ
jgi:membrane fusion protein (multidrug efflux system)